jgi:hypothetical protein
MQRHKAHATFDHDSLPVLVPRNDKALVPIAPERVRRLRKHLVATLRASGAKTRPVRSTSITRAEPAGFAGRVARAACALCKGWCCRNGADDAFLDERTMTRVRHASPMLDARAVLRFYVERVPQAAYAGSCIFHSGQGCTLDRSLRSDVCNRYFCGGLQGYLTGSDVTTPAMVFAGEGHTARTSPILMP